MPVLATGHARAVRVVRLMTGRTIEAWYTFASRSADNVEQMAVPIIPLLRIARRSVAVDAARRRQHGVDLLPGGKTTLARRARRFLRGVLADATYA